MDDLRASREDFTNDKEYLQGAGIQFNKGKIFQTHRHIYCERSTDITQEVWIVMKGSVLVKYYDLDDTFLCKEIIKVGDCTITFAGGHGFEGMSDDTFVYEFKSGPYYGRDVDKVFLEENK